MPRIGISRVDLHDIFFNEKIAKQFFRHLKMPIAKNSVFSSLQFRFRACDDENHKINTHLKINTHDEQCRNLVKMKLKSIRFDWEFDWKKEDLSTWQSMRLVQHYPNETMRAVKISLIQKISNFYWLFLRGESVCPNRILKFLRDSWGAKSTEKNTDWKFRLSKV